MSVEITSTNPVVRAIIGGTAPAPAVMAAARGILPLPQTDLLEVLVYLAKGADTELAAAADSTIGSQDPASLSTILEAPDAAPAILAFFVEKEDLSEDVYQTIILNPKTPDNSIIKFVRQTKSGSLLELVALNQQRLIRVPAIIDGIIANPFRSIEAERRASETKREFFEKERGAKQIADELRARGQEAAAEFIETAEFADDLGGSGMSVEDALFIAQHIEIPDSEIDDSWLSLEYIEDFYEETPEERREIVNKILGELAADDNELTSDRISMVSRILMMSMKDRVKLAQKGDREARTILIRDPNRIVAQAVINNPRITDQEVEKIAAMRTVPEDVLRQIAINRKYVRNYATMHSLAKNPRTPMGNIITIMMRLQLKDLEGLMKNKNVSDAVRKQALRLVTARKGR